MKEITEEQWSKPFSPDFIIQNKDNFIPEEMIKAVNMILAEKYNGSSVDIKQDEIVDKFMSLVGDKFKKNDIFEKNFLDFESVFRKVGWSVEYDKPGYCENYDAFFTFKKKK